MNAHFHLRRMLLLAEVALAMLAGAAMASAQTLETLVNFDGADGASPPAPLIQGSDGNLWGTTYAGGANSGGTIFNVTTAGALTTLYNFCAAENCADGQGPNGTLVQATDGNYYGTTLIGGTHAAGTVFRLTPAGALTTLYSFCVKTACADGERPFAGLIQASDGSFYGTTLFGGAYNNGTVFRITPAGAFRLLHSFEGEDGAQPYGGVIEGSDGNLYGTTYYGGSAQSGTVFKMTPAGSVTTLHSFCSQSNCADGAQPYSALVEATDGRFYGTTEHDGAHQSGTIFRVTSAGSLTTLNAFCTQNACADGGYPHAALIQATDGVIYGTTDRGGAAGYGTIFSFSGSLTTLASFLGSNGAEPDGLLQAASGSFYGTTLLGGSNSLCPYKNGCGIIFSFSMASHQEPQP
jgi:uncharacterized repeat protein (TIGR03803 family)